MKFAFSPKLITEAPAGYVRVRLLAEDKGTKRFVREGKTEWLEIGVGTYADISSRRLPIIARSIIQTAKSFKIKRVALAADALAFPKLKSVSAADLAERIAINMEMANFDFITLKTKPKEGWKSVDEVLLCGPVTKEEQAGYLRGVVIAKEVNRTRELAGSPGGHMTPRGLAASAKAAVTGLPVTVTTMGRAAIKKTGMGLLAGVGEGSANEPTFTVMQYNGGKKGERPIVLAGKGITFDAGGLNLKPSNSIYEMHMDMSGGAAVIHTVALAARLKIKKNIVGLIPAAENLVGPNATRPGDVHRSLSGKTVEVTDTDAEGRLVLADALTYAKRFNPSVVIDVATLTGAVMIALGLHASGLMTRDEKLAKQLLELGEESGDYLWRLPLWDEYESVVKSEFADLQNHSIANGRYGGATNGAIFLWQFAKDLGCPWAHLDIASRMTSTQGDELAKGAAGTPVRLLIKFIEAWNPSAPASK